MALSVFVLMALATWRLARLLVDPEELGPWGVLVWLRIRLGWRWDEYGELYFVGSGIRRQLATMISCVWCSSVWIGLVFTVIYLISPTAAVIVALPLALSTAAIVIQEVLRD
jgi:hypothetical protein